MHCPGKHGRSVSQSSHTVGEGQVRSELTWRRRVSAARSQCLKGMVLLYTKLLASVEISAILRGLLSGRDHVVILAVRYLRLLSCSAREDDHKLGGRFGGLRGSCDISLLETR